MDLQTILSYILNALPAAFLFIVGFVWHTRSTLASLQEEIKDAKNLAASIGEKTESFSKTLSNERAERRSSVEDLYGKINNLDKDHTRLETLIGIQSGPQIDERRNSRRR